MSEPTAPSTDQNVFIQELRHQTSESHQNLENNALSMALMQPAVSIAEYQLYLSKMYGIMKGCEDEIFPLLAGFVPDLDKRKKAGFILKDLSSTGVKQHSIENIPVFKFNCTDVADAFGIMYVLEGSTLGGRVIYKHVHQHLGLTPERGAMFFSGYGSNTGILWKSFISSLTQFTIESGETNSIINSAKKTFVAIDNWLSDRN